MPSDTRSFFVEPKLFPGASPADVYVSTSPAGGSRRLGSASASAAASVSKSCADYMLPHPSAWTEKCAGGAACACKGSMRVQDPSASDKWVYKQGPIDCTYAAFGVTAAGTPESCQCATFPSDCQAVVYAADSFGGASATFGVGNFDGTAFTSKIADNAVSSVKVVGEHCGAVLYENSGYTGG